MRMYTFKLILNRSRPISCKLWSNTIPFIHRVICQWNGFQFSNGMASWFMPSHHQQIPVAERWATWCPVRISFTYFINNMIKNNLPTLFKWKHKIKKVMLGYINYGKYMRFMWEWMMCWAASYQKYRLKCVQVLFCSAGLSLELTPSRK